MQKLIWIGIIASIFLLGCLQLNQINQPTPAQLPTACLEAHCVNVSIADTPELRERGLMGVTALTDMEGMLFIFDSEERHAFWMKDTKIPLDMIWINKEFEIVDIRTMQPCTQEPCEIYSPQANALYVLEVNAGLTQKWQVAVGGKASIGIPTI